MNRDLLCFFILFSLITFNTLTVSAKSSNTFLDHLSKQIYADCFGKGITINVKFPELSHLEGVPTTVDVVKEVIKAIDEHSDESSIYIGGLEGIPPLLECEAYKLKYNLGNYYWKEERVDIVVVVRPTTTSKPTTTTPPPTKSEGLLSLEAIMEDVRGAVVYLIVAGALGVIWKRNYIKRQMKKIGSFKEEEIKKPQIEYGLSGVLPGTIKFNFKNDWRVWFFVRNLDERNFKVYFTASFHINDKFIDKIKRDHYSGKKAWNLNSNSYIKAPGLTTPQKVRDEYEKTKKKGKFEIRINCEIKDENDNHIDKRLPVGYVYDSNNDNWYFEP